MGQKQDGRTQYSISCPCGARVSMDARMFGRPTVCRKCGGSFTVGWGKDPRTGKPAPVAVSMARKRSETPLQVHCACGYRRAVSAAEAAERNRCPGCGRDMMVEKPPASKARESSRRVAAPEARRTPEVMLQLHCACGYRRAVTPTEAAGRNRCPGCGKEMVVEKPAGRKTRESDRILKLSSAAPARPKPATPSMQVVQLISGTQAFTCLCGERIMVRSGTIGSVTQCRVCDRQIKVELRTPTPLPGTLPGGRNPTPLPGGRTPTPLPGLTCECGERVEILKAFDAKGTVCPRCGRTITMEKVRTLQGKNTIIRPRFLPKGSESAAPPPKPEPEPAAEPPTADFVEEEDVDAPAMKISRSSFQEVFCPCGEALTVGTDDAGKNIQCPTCFTLMAVERIRDGNTANYVLRVRGIGKMDQDTWSLSDFS
ncbi:MAG TPA: hypothetical protein VNM14_05825 [Planctomycetota bacterium]|nr:hypothetical protein [Planctomycetota bacterium]